MKKRLLILFFIVVMLISACSKRDITRRYYTIALATPAAMDTLLADTTFNYRVDIRDFLVARAFEQTRIAVRTATHELKYFHYHHWAVRPAYAIADMLYYVFDKKQMFRYISRGLSYNPDYIITGEVKSLERVYTKSKDLVHVSLVIRLEKDSSTGRVLVRHDADVTRVMQDDQSMNRFAAIVSDIIYETSTEFMAKVAEQFQQ